MNYYLGADGGGTKTTIAIAGENGNIIYTATGKTINFYSVGMETARENLKELLSRAEGETGINSFKGAFVGCSALDDEANEETLNALCGGIISAEKIAMNSDIFVAMKASGGKCVAICGTGSIALAENSKGHLSVKGGWGHILGDEGSAYAISVEALKKVCSDWDENRETPLTSAVKTHFDTEKPRNLIEIIYSPQATKDVVAAFGAVVGEMADNGDMESLEIITTQAKAFAKTVTSLLIEANKAQLCLYGGVFKNCRSFRETFESELRKSIPQLDTELLKITPEQGAIKAAMEL